MKKLFAILLALPLVAFAWQPNKPITVVAPVAPGAGNEMAFRALSRILERQNTAHFVITNKAGADGNIGMNWFVENAATDGYTIAIPSCQSTFVASDIVFKSMIKYDPMELGMITNIGKSPLVFVVNAKSPIKTVPELIREVQSGRRNINFAVGGAAHALAWDYFMSNTNGDRDRIKSVMYKGPLPAVTDAAAGITEFAIVPATVANTLVPTGKIRILGIAGEQKIKQWPDVPLMNKFVPGLNVYACWNMVLPKNTPKEITNWYVKTFVEALNSDEYRQWAQENMVIIDRKAQSPEGLYRDMRALRDQWQPYVARQAAFGVK